MNRAKPIALDLFSGVGGMSLGVRQAGFRVVGAFDSERRHVASYKKNFRQSKAFVIDLGQANGDELRSLAGVENDDIDLLFGGPPCQGFSMGGRRDKKDKRNLLLQDFARLVGEIQPKYFMLENVAGLTKGNAKRDLHRFLSKVQKSGYAWSQEYRVLDASDHGVPQRRKRVFVIGRRERFPDETVPASSPIISVSGEEYFPRVRDAICDLPDVDRYQYLFSVDAFTGRLRKSSHYAMLMRGELKEPTDKTRQRKPPQILTGCLRTRHSPDVVRRFDRTSPGSQEPVSRYYRLALDGVSPTIRAGTGSDKGSHTSPRPIHPTKPRCITVREAARLHSFPDWFQFDETRWHAFRQIGNSVPPRLARSVASAIVTNLC